MSAGSQRRGILSLTPVLASAGVLAVAVACSSEPAADAPPVMLTREQLMDPQTCAGCHPDHVREWSGSMHAYAGVDPVFLALNKRMQRETNGANGTFCVNCHAPLAVRQGLTADGLNLDRLDPKLLGVTCYFCHNSEFAGGALHNNPLVTIDDGVMRGGFRDPVPSTPHGAKYSSFTDQVHDSSAIACGSCHDIVNPLGSHIERTFVEWRRSHIAVEKRQNCGFCHMPARTGLAAQGKGVLVRQVHDHSMPGVDLALTPFPEMGPQREGVQKILDDALSSRLCVTLDPATNKVSVEVTLLSETVGHGFPSGSAQDRRAWVELEAFSNGAVAFESGHIPEGRAVAEAGDPGMLLLRDRHFDAEDHETHLFWKTARIESTQVPVNRSSREPESSRSRTHVYTFDGPLPERVSMRVKIRPIDVDLISELVSSGDIDPAIAARIPTLTLARTEVTWAGGDPCAASPPKGP